MRVHSVKQTAHLETQSENQELTSFNDSIIEGLFDIFSLINICLMYHKLLK